ncbi:AmmeMemoRadiSam system protein B [Variovorax sp. MHTC-1]|uniref:AmmeMemoRadiSam system protein B n=1 Tax=Variovorax sp. MHTC-1 TaxID=2495593 RepID=UPI000F867100|nr:AmmeMemoRadiSam system protein B [Variovorax sp. MHTC-1]RST55719.1 AmmeMemoRadiSam system protein B [Variovorax sp. MHTC-1]
MPAVRPAAVAGTFYPSDALQLQREVGDCLAAADSAVAESAHPPKLLIVPHAGYVYSGAVAAQAYALLAPWRDRITRVVLIGPAHRCAVRALAAPEADAFDTPLGRIALEHASLARLGTPPQVVHDDWPHAFEHSLEVQLPFLQMVLDSFALVPLLVGSANPSELAQVLDRLWGGDETLIVVSSDLSHYLPYAQAQARDRATVQRILAFDGALVPEEACGALAINGALQAARSHGLQPRLLDLRNSGDTAGDRRRVVGYAAIAFEAPPS